MMMPSLVWIAHAPIVLNQVHEVVENLDGLDRTRRFRLLAGILRFERRALRTERTARILESHQELRIATGDGFGFRHVRLRAARARMLLRRPGSRGPLPLSYRRLPRRDRRPAGR